jgi:hypothetical protein
MSDLSALRETVRSTYTQAELQALWAQLVTTLTRGEVFCLPAGAAIDLTEPLHVTPRDKGHEPGSDV